MTLTDPQLDCAGCLKVGKCCDFQPFIPNYLVGAMLAAGVALPNVGEHHWQPLGLIPAGSFRERHSRTPEGLRGSDLFCSFFDGGCSIYKFRPGECRNYFCEGMTDGHHAASIKAFTIETSMAQSALEHLGFPIEAVHAQVDVLNLQGEPRPAVTAEMMAIYRGAWAWAGQHRSDEVQRFL